MDNIRRGHHFNIRRAMERTTARAIAQMGLALIRSISVRHVHVTIGRKLCQECPSLTLTNKGMHVMGMVSECGIRPRRLIRPLFILLEATASGT